MKKQILFLVMALFSTTFAFGQVNTTAKPGSAPNTLTGCADDALHPIAGKPYTYKLTGTPVGGTYTWWATTDPNFISTTGTTTTNNLSTKLGSPTTTPVGTALTATSANYGTTGATDEVSITWGSTILSTTTYNTAPTFVVGYYEALTPNCADNLKVYQLDPKNGFIVDIRNIDGTTIKGYSEAIAQCIDDVRSAKFVTNQVEYNFGTNIMAYEVVAANFSEEWTPAFTLTGLNAAQSSLIQWTYDAPATWSATTVWNAATDKVVTTETNTSTGVSIYVRVTISNNTYEGIADTPVTLAVAGTNKDSEIDVNNADCTEPATLVLAAADDTAVQTLTQRPTITPGTVGAPAPNTTIVTGNNVN